VLPSIQLCLRHTRNTATAEPLIGVNILTSHIVRPSGHAWLGTVRNPVCTYSYAFTDRELAPTLPATDIAIGGISIQLNAKSSGVNN
jgi:hypothetical protein